MLDAGRTIRQIATELGLANNTVRYHACLLSEDREASDQRPPRDFRHTVAAIRTRNRVRELLDAGFSKAEIARQLGVTKSTVSYHARRLGEPVDERGARRYDWSAVQELYDAGRSKRECELAFGFSSQSWHMAVKRGDIKPRPHAMPLEQLLSGARNRSHLKARLISLGLKEERCEECGITEWRGRRISFALHHVNGDGSDNRLENLQLLCGNCHSQTDNFSGKKRRLAD